jgi:hypothetical protein
LSVNLSGLAANTSYDWRVRATCTAGTGSYSQASFTTAGVVNPCPGAYDVTSNGTISGAATIPLNTDVFGLIEVRGDDDHYKFIITTGGTITMSLSNLPADYQLALLSSSGSVLQTSATNGTGNEVINRTVTAGTYYARVYPRKTNVYNASNCYTLRVQTGTASKFDPINVQEVNTVSVSPNPAVDMINISFDATAGGKVIVSIIDQNGSVVVNKNLSAVTGKNTSQLDVSNLANGVYYIKLQTGSVVKMTKLVVGK